jgi:hypothetical protein
MSLYVLDTDIMTLYQHDHPRVTQNILAHPISELAIAVISVEEDLSGWYTKLRQARKRDQLAAFINAWPRQCLFSRASRSRRSPSPRLFAMRAFAPRIATSAKTICGSPPPNKRFPSRMWIGVRMLNSQPSKR